MRMEIHETGLLGLKDKYNKSLLRISVWKNLLSGPPV